VQIFERREDRIDEKLLFELGDSFVADVRARVSQEEKDQREAERIYMGQMVVVVYGQINFRRDLQPYSGEVRTLRQGNSTGHEQNRYIQD